MKLFIIKNLKRHFGLVICLTGCLLLSVTVSNAQDSTGEEKPAPVKIKPVKNTFQSIWIIDNQTVLVPVKGTLEMDIMHRFGTVEKGYDDFWGFFAPSNIRLAVGYAPVNKLFVGFGITKEHKVWDVNAKYSIITQTPKKYPVSVTYYGNIGIDSREKPVIYDNSEIKHPSDRLSYFHQLLIARKLTDKLSVQIAPSYSHQNAVAGYYTKNDSTGKEIFKTMKHGHFAIALSARMKLTNVTSIMLNYDQPITKHPTNNPNPNLSFGVEFNTSSHSFQLFVGNYFSLSPQRNNLYNRNNPFEYTDDASGQKVKGGMFLIGFNITRLWNY